MVISLNLPSDVERRLRQTVPNLDGKVRETVAVELFRTEQITHFELGQILGLDRYQTDDFLTARNEMAQTVSIDDVRKDCVTIRDTLRFACS